MPTAYDPATREKAIRLVTDHRADYDSEWSAIKTIASRLGMTPETLRKWVRQAEIDTGQREGISTSFSHENRELRRKIRELEETVEILKAAASFFARESDPRSR